MRHFCYISVIAFVLVFSSCDKEDSKESYLEEFVSIAADKDSLTVNQTTTIRAVAKGENLEYLWFSDAGVFVEYHGDHVVYTAPDCSRGKKEISCTIRADNRSETKRVYIYVY